jgi:cytochrome c biogenesis protein CcdA
MEEYLSDLIATSSWPLLSALALGLLTAISPCPMATNITAIGFISRDIDNPKKVILKGLIYTLGRMTAYTGLALIIYLTAGELKVSGVFQSYGEKIIGPVLIIIGLLMLDVIPVRFPSFSSLTNRFQAGKNAGNWSVFFLGVLFALAFCPYSGVLYFGILMPLTISSESGLLLPVVFALTTGLPVILFAWLLAYAVGEIGGWYNRLQNFEKWFRKIVAILFLLVGSYYVFFLIKSLLNE